MAIPVFNEQEVVGPLCDRLLPVLRGLGCPYEIVFVDDGSRDATVLRLAAISEREPNLRVVCLSRNFGLQAAVAAALAHCRGDVVVLMDGDLQDPPELIPSLLQHWGEGADVVYTIKRSRAERGLRRVAFDAFHWIFRKLAQLELSANAGNFSLLGRRALEVLLRMPERNRYLPGLRAWVGFKQAEVAFDRDGRAAGKPQMGLWKLTKLALDAIFGFSYLPLRVATGVGALACAVGVVLVGWAAVERFITHTAILGWPSLMLAVCFLGGAQLLTIGILGEYVGRIYDEVRGRPTFVVNGIIGGELAPSAVPAAGLKGAADKVA